MVLLNPGLLRAPFSEPPIVTHDALGMQQREHNELIQVCPTK